MSKTKLFKELKCPGCGNDWSDPDAYKFNINNLMVYCAGCLQEYKVKVEMK